MIIDAHCHPQLSDFQDIYLDTWQENCLFAAATTPDDFKTLEELRSRYPWLQTSIGIHPWKLSTIFPSQELKVIEDALQNSPRSLGECGLDFSPKYKNNSALQSSVLEYFFVMAKKFQVPIILHCVKAHHEILRLLKRYPKQKLLLHGFHGSEDLVQQYLRYDCYFGISIFNLERHPSIIPIQRLLLESDGLAPLSDFKIAYQRLSQIRKFSFLKMEEQLESNYQRLLIQGTVRNMIKQIL